MQSGHLRRRFGQLGPSRFCSRMRTWRCRRFQQPIQPVTSTGRRHHKRKLCWCWIYPVRKESGPRVALAAHGYRPVPLYNAVPLPSEESLLDSLAGQSVVAVNVLPIIRALNNGAAQLANCNLPPDAPPVFLLDADRHGNWRKMQPDEFDNRSICFTTDFPSANFLWTQGIRRALIVQRTSTVPHPDLTHVLRRWQDGGLSLERVRVDFPAKPERFEVSRPSWYGAMFQRVLSAFGLHRAGSGGFGAWMPESPAGG